MADDNKKKDEIEENINQDNQGDIHEADDTFGLPDIDFDPVTPDEPKEEAPAKPETKEEEQTAEPETEDVDQPYMYASRVEDEPEEPVSEETSSDDDWSSTSAEDSSAADDSETLYHATETESETETGTDYSASMEEEEQQSEEEEKSAYVPGSYSSRQESSNNTPGIVIGVLLVLALIAVGTWYFISYRPAQQAEAEQLALQEQQDEQRAQDEEAARQAEAERAAAEEEAARQAAAEAEEEVVPETGTIETISARTGRYYVVVASAVDGDLAMDYANKLSETGNNVKIIEPYGSVIFHRVAISDLASWDEAQKVADDMKAEYGDGVWVKKY